MSFYFRKSRKFGPIRLNLSKSGIGISTGIKGARISTGPRGTYIHLGSNGFYYCQRIDGSIGTSSSPPGDSTVSETMPTDNQTDEISGSTIEVSDKELVTQINARIERRSYSTFLAIVSTIMAAALAAVPFVIPIYLSVIPENFHQFFPDLLIFVAGSIWVAGMMIAWATNRYENKERTTALRYKLADQAKKESFIALQNGLANLVKSERIWQVTSNVPNWDWKRQAGASSLVTRNRVTAGHMSPPFIKTNVKKTYGISFGYMQWFFLPDQVFVWQKGRYSAASYSALQVYVTPTRFIESEAIPSDSRVVDYTWQYVRKDGGPDMRFINNRRLPIAEYAHVGLALQPRSWLDFNVSNLAYAEQFVQVKWTRLSRHWMPQF
jgi:hypothetical protein